MNNIFKEQLSTSSERVLFCSEFGGKKFGKAIIFIGGPLVTCLDFFVPYFSFAQLASEGLREPLTYNEVFLLALVALVVFSLISIPSYIIFIKKDLKWRYLVRDNILICETPSGRAGFNVEISEIKSIRPGVIISLYLNSGERLLFPTILWSQREELFNKLKSINPCIVYDRFS